MNMTPEQEARFWDYQDTFAALTIEDLEASNWKLFAEWEATWTDYVRNGPQPGSDRPPNKPDHP